MFDIQSLQSNSENPTFLIIFLAVVTSIILSSLLVFIYDMTTNSIERNNHYMQSMVLISIVATTVMQAVGDSLARGLGMLGALAIIRFRTTLRDPRHMTFMFASLAVGIACGVYGFTIAFVGTIGFAVTALILRFSHVGKKDSLTGELKITVLEQEGNIEEIEKLIKLHTKGFVLTEYRLKESKIVEDTSSEPEPIPVVGQPIYKRKKTILGFEKQRELSYNIKIKKGKENALYNTLKEKEMIKDIRLKFNKLEQIL